jgi:hypothetical protein
MLRKFFKSKGEDLDLELHSFYKSQLGASSNSQDKLKRLLPVLLILTVLCALVFYYTMPGYFEEQELTTLDPTIAAKIMNKKFPYIRNKLKVNEEIRKQKRQHILNPRRVSKESLQYEEQQN